MPSGSGGAELTAGERTGRTLRARQRPEAPVAGGAVVGLAAALAILLAGTCGCWFRGRPGPPDYDRLEPGAQALWERALSARDAGDLDAARARLEQLAEVEPRFFRGIREWQEILASMGRADAARDCAAIPPPSSAPALTLAARLEEDPQRAEALLEDALEADPGFAWAWLGLGFLQRSRGDYPAARRSLRQAVDLYPDFPEALHDLAVVEYEVGEAREARVLLEHFLDLRPEDRGARHLLASLLATVLLDYPRAAEEYRELSATDPEDVKALMGLAGALALGEGDGAEAAALYLRVLRKDPGMADALYNLGWLCETRLGRPREALRWYRRYLEWDAPGPDPRSLLYVVYFVPNRVARLEKMLDGTAETPELPRE